MERNNKTASARTSVATLARSEYSGLAVGGRWRGWDLRATGLYAGAVLAAAGTIGSLLWAEPLADPRHFVLTMLACFISGAFFSVGSTHGRLQDALRSKEDFRLEMNRIAERNQELERIILKTRLSSLTPAQSARSALQSNKEGEQLPPGPGKDGKGDKATMSKARRGSA